MRYCGNISLAGSLACKWRRWFIKLHTYFMVQVFLRLLVWFFFLLFSPVSQGDAIDCNILILRNCGSVLYEFMQKSVRQDVRVLESPMNIAYCIGKCPRHCILFRSVPDVAAWIYLPGTSFPLSLSGTLSLSLSDTLLFRFFLPWTLICTLPRLLITLATTEVWIFFRVQFLHLQPMGSSLLTYAKTDWPKWPKWSKFPAHFSTMHNGASP